MPNFRISRVDIVQAQLNYLDKMAKELESLLGAKDYRVYSYQARNAKRSSYSSITPIFSSKHVSQGTDPSLDSYKSIFTSALHDLNILYQQVNILGQDIVNNFNDIQSVVVQIEAKVSKIRSLVADYRIYSLYPQAGFFFLGDSFDDTSKVDKTSEFIDSTCCYIDSLSGVATLPAENIENQSVSNVVINSESNGVHGNNNEFGVPRHKRLQDLFDRNPETWFEYERVGRFTPPLVLSLTLKLDAEAVINNINLSAINFGTRSWPIIRALDTSLDGRQFISIKDDLPLVDWGYEDEENVFDPGASYRQTGTTSFIVTPRKARFVRVVLEQDSSYLIQTASGQKERWAIGVRDIEINGIKFSPTGDLVSYDYLTGDPIKKVALSTNQLPSFVNEESVGNIQHLISIDNGQNWIEISPIELSNNSIDEVVNFDETVDLEGADPTTIKYKAVLSRNAEAFSSDGLADSTLHKSQFIPFPAYPPFSMTLEEEPVKDSVTVINPLGGEVGENWSTKYYVGMIASDDEDELEFELPFDDLANKTIHVKVGTVEWTRTWHLEGALATDKKFFIDINQKILKFGDDTHGKKPTTGKPIFLWFDRERVYFDTDNPIKATLDYSTTGLQSRVLLYREAGIVEETQDIPAGQVKIPLLHRNLYYTKTGGVMDTPFQTHPDPPASPVSTISPLPDPGDPLYTWVPFENGYKEFINYSGGIATAITDGAYTVDPVNGILYLPFDETTTPIDMSATPSASVPMSVTYEYYNRVYVPDYKWSFDSNDKERKTLFVDDDAFGTESYTVLTNNGSLNVGDTVWNLGLYSTASNVLIKSMVPKSVFFQHSVNGIEEWIEVPYDNGKKEFDFLETDEEKALYFSVDYKNGIIYSAVTPLYDSTYYYTISFQFTNYFAEYIIGLPLKPDEDWEFDGDKDIKLTDEYSIELLSAFDLAGEKTKKALRISYDYKSDIRNDLKDLEPYYSPVLKEYRMIIVTEEGLSI